MSIIGKKHIADGKLVLALCDAHLVGKTLEDGTAQVKLTQMFFGGEVLLPEEIPTLVKKAFSVNAVGKEIIALLTEHELIGQTDIKKVAGIPYALIFSV